jgi:UDP-N-acetylmuramoylalanine--D-glutamate ligase
VIVLDNTDTRAMNEVVRTLSLTQPDDNVLLASGCASKDMYSGHDAGGDAFEAVVRQRPTGTG